MKRQMILKTASQRGGEESTPFLGPERACLSCRKGGQPTVQFQMHNFIPLKKSLLLRQLSPFPPALSSFPGHRIQSKSWQEHRLGLVASHSTVLFLSTAPCRLTLSGNASSSRKAQDFPGSQDSANAASTNTAAEQPQVGHGREETLQQCTLTMGRRPCNLRSSSENTMGWQPGSLQQRTLNHSPPPLFRKI